MFPLSDLIRKVHEYVICYPNSQVIRNLEEFVKHIFSLSYPIPISDPARNILNQILGKGYQFDCRFIQYFNLN